MARLPGRAGSGGPRRSVSALRMCVSAVCVCVSSAQQEVEATLRSALLPPGASASHPLLFDADALHAAFPDPLGRSVDARLAGLVVPAGRKRGAEPIALLDLAFGQGPTPHSEPQQTLQLWLFARCDRLPRAAGEGVGLRRQCVESVATFAAMAAKAKPLGDPDAPPVMKEPRRQLAIVLGLQRRSTYLEGQGEGAGAADAAVDAAAEGAMQDEELRRLMAEPMVKKAVAEIAADPSAVDKYAGEPKVMQALELLNSHLQPQ